MNHLDMYLLAHEFHYTPDQIKNMDMIDRADLISSVQAIRQGEDAQRNKKPKRKTISGRVPIEDQAMNHLMEQYERKKRGEREREINEPKTI